ncbi:ribitol 5-phosphate transferase FKRP-like [Sycon ciliatum]|uniref:ribitol 5-phosphate transferase FKRP-like n=1 Tax=Sycon ciliatum TaxID=27933 RepID=UPI0031F6E788
MRRFPINIMYPSWKLYFITLLMCALLLAFGVEVVLRVYQVEGLHVHQVLKPALAYVRFNQPCYPSNQAFRLKELVRNTKNFAAVADEVGLRYWLDYGTLLAAHRSGRIIPWDHDADMGAMQIEFMANFNELKRLLAKRGDVLYYGGACRYFIRRAVVPEEARGEIIRAEVVLHVPIVNLGQDNDQLITRCEVPDIFRYTFPRRYIDTMTTVTFEGVDMTAPNPVKEFLAVYRYPNSYWLPVPYRINCYFESMYYFSFLVLFVAVLSVVGILYFCAMLHCLARTLPTVRSGRLCCVPTNLASM